MNRYRLAICAVLVGCGAPPVAHRAPPAPSASAAVATPPAPASIDAGAPAVAAAPAVEVPMAWGTAGTGSGPLYAIADGMCVNAQVFPIEGGAIFVYGNGEYINWQFSNPTLVTTALVGPDGITPDPGRGFGPALDADGATVFAVGGSYPDHLFAILDYASRAGFARQLRVGSAKPTGWKTLLGTPPRDYPPNGMFVAIAPPLAWNDGNLLFPTDTSPVRNGLNDFQDTYGFRVLQADGTFVPKANVPGPDLGEPAFRINEPRQVARLSNGEVVGIRWGAKKKLVRWSPTKPVDDVAFPVTPAKDAMFRGGKSRAVVALDDALYIYDGKDALVPAKVNSKLAKGFAWTLGPDDEILVIQPTGAVIEESTTGVLHEETLPFAATFSGVPSGIGWGIANGKGARGSDALVHKKTTEGAKRWEVVELPAPPFGSDGRAPLRIADVAARDPNDVFFIAQRSEPGFGWKRPPSFRVLYRTKRPREVVRCQDAPHAWTGTGTHRWPPAADDTCTTPVVVASFGDSAAKGYPTMLAAALRGKTQFGDTLSFVTFEGRGTTNVGILMSDVAKAKALATQLAILDLRPEVSCGKPAAVRTFTLDVARGTFSP